MFWFYLLFIALFIVYAGPCMEASREAVSMFLFGVLPSLLPFFIVSRLLLDSPFTEKISRLFNPVMAPVFGVSGAGAAALLPGILCGYPVGAAACADLYGRGLLEKAEAERLSAFSSNTGPFFVVGAVGAALCRSPGAGIVLLAIHIAAGLVTGVLLRFYRMSESIFIGAGKIRTVSHLKSGLKIKKHAVKNTRHIFANSSEASSKNGEPFGQILGKAVSKSVMDVMTVGGFIVIFAVIISIVRQTGIPAKIGRLLMGSDYRIAEGIICGIIEITSGCNMLAKSGRDIISLLPYLSFVLGFGGLSVHAQIISILNNAKLRSFPFIIGKTLQGILAAFFTFFAVSVPAVRNYILSTSQTSQTSSFLFHNIINIISDSLIANLLVLLAAVLLARISIRYLQCMKNR